jgi:hypothetical protein
LGIVGPNLSVLRLSLLPLRYGTCRSAAFRGYVCSASPAAASGANLLVLLPCSRGLLSLREAMPRRLDEGCSFTSSTIAGCRKTILVIRLLCVKIGGVVSWDYHYLRLRYAMFPITASSSSAPSPQSRTATSQEPSPSVLCRP